MSHGGEEQAHGYEKSLLRTLIDDTTPQAGMPQLQGCGKHSTEELYDIRLRRSKPTWFKKNTLTFGVRVEPSRKGRGYPRDRIDISMAVSEPRGLA